MTSDLTWPSDDEVSDFIRIVQERDKQLLSPTTVRIALSVILTARQRTDAFLSAATPERTDSNG